MINLEIVLSQLEDALRGVSKTNADQLSEDDRISIAEMIISLQMQLGMVGKEAHIRFGSKLDALKAAAADVDIKWRIT